MREIQTQPVTDSAVELRQATLGELFGLSTFEYSLKIPDYQRIYCWEEKHVLRLLKDISARSSRSYHLGTIILHQTTDKAEFDVVDGQQRLITLCLLLNALNTNEKLSLLEQEISSEEARSYIAYNKWLIQNYLDKSKDINRDHLVENLLFSVLILKNTSLDLAFTFFTAENSKGKSLTDFDLLKSHHLRYVTAPEQAEHVAGRWDDLIRSNENDNMERPLARSLALYLFRLRKWTRKQNWDEGEKRKIKNHFEAAPIIPDIPPFGEQFWFAETIQGGAHFFAFAEHFVQKFNLFSQTDHYKELHTQLAAERHWWYRDVIEAFTFAYFIKFGHSYLAQALCSILEYVSSHRYANSRAKFSSILQFASESEIVMMINQATSPTFFLAEMEIKNELLPKVDKTQISGTRLRYFNQFDSLIQNLKRC